MNNSNPVVMTTDRLHRPYITFYDNGTKTTKTYYGDSSALKSVLVERSDGTTNLIEFDKNGTMAT